MYLCGHTIEEIVEKKVPEKLSKICEMDFSFEFSAVAMVELKDNESACIVYGTTNQNQDIPRGWVEFRAEDRTRYVRDFYSDRLDIPYIEHQHRFYPETERIYLHYIFWTRYTEALYELTQKPETSYLLDYFFRLRPEFRNDGKIYGNTDFYGSGLTPTSAESDVLAIARNRATEKTTIITKDLFDSLLQ